MTRNQISFYEAREKARSNRANETENYRSNRAREQETNRANVANEGIQRDKNTITLGYNNQYLAELNRHNMATEFLSKQQNANAAKQAQAALQSSQASALSAQANWRNAETQSANLGILQQQADAATRNASSNAMNAETAAKRGITEAFKAQQDIELSKQKQSESEQTTRLTSNKAEREAMAGAVDYWSGPAKVIQNYTGILGGAFSSIAKAIGS